MRTSSRAQVEIRLGPIPEKGTIKMNRTPPAVFVDLDTQHDFLNPEGKACVPDPEPLVENLKTLTDFAAEASVPIVASIVVNPESGEYMGALPAHCIASSPGAAKIPETTSPNVMTVPSQPLDQTILFDSQLIIERPGFDIFANVNTEEIFAAFPTKRVVVYGVPAEFSVTMAVEELCRRGLNVHVVRDAVGALWPEKKESSLADMSAAGARFVNTADLLEQLRKG
jgi:nicotinamidase/pyrazinamidase